MVIQFVVFIVELFNVYVNLWGVPWTTTATVGLTLAAVVKNKLAINPVTPTVRFVGDTCGTLSGVGVTRSTNSYIH